MTWRRCGPLFAHCVTLSTTACSGDDSTARDDDIALDGGSTSTTNDPPPPPEPTYEPTFTAIYSEVFATSNCTLGLCHGEGARGGGLDLHPIDDAYAAMVGVASTSDGCASLGLAMVEPGDPDASLLFAKLFDPPPCGDLMPPDEPLSDAQIEQIRGWISAGAMDD